MATTTITVESSPGAWTIKVAVRDPGAGTFTVGNETRQFVQTEPYAMTVVASALGTNLRDRHPIGSIVNY